MTTPISPQNTAHNPNRCYCFNPDCQHPENPQNNTVCQSCGTPLQLQERFRAIQLLGQGGFGRTFKAIDESKSSLIYCAIKQFFPQQSSHNATKASELFRQEAQRLDSLGNHPQIPTFLEYFEENGRQYLVQAFISGRPLNCELSEEGAFDENKVRLLLLDVLPLLHFIHSHHIIHRDIKPENIIRSHDGRLVLVDFGAAKYATETTLGKTGTVIGSAAYTAPEQVRGKAVFASDIYSLGVTGIHLLTEMAPFDLFDSSEDAWVWQQYLGENKVSKSLSQILDKMLQGGTKRRYQTATDVLKDLSAPTSTPSYSRHKWWAASIILIFGFMGLRYLVSPVVQQVSTPPPEVLSETSKEEEKSRSETGGLFATVDGKKEIFPLENTSVNARVAGNISRVEVTQTFANPFDKPLEAVYKFPLPDEAAVDDMEIVIGDRVIRGVIKKREEAQKIYEEAKKEGKTAGLLEQERANIFTQSLANIKPGETIDVVIRYTTSLKFEGGDYEFVFPMVVAPRYVSGTQEGVYKMMGGAAIASPINPPILPKGTRSGHDIDVTLEIDAGVEISEVRSPTHQEHLEVQKSSSITRVKLSNSETIPNKDLIVRYQVASAATQATVLTQSNEQGGHFATYLIPAVEYDPQEIVPKDVVFLIDTSGSQRGSAIAQSKELMRQFINGLNADDTFTIIDFANQTRKLSSQPLLNTPQNRKRAINYVSSLAANGGTELMNGIETVLNFAPAEEGRLRSIVLLTDGLIGDDKRVIGEVAKGLKSGNRLYSFGVGSSTNRFLINRLAEVGRGTAEILPPNEPAVEVAEEFFQEINNPVLTNIEVNWEGSGDAPEIYPQRLPDLFANQPLVLYGRQTEPVSGTLRITGIMAGGKRYEKLLNVNFEGVRGNGAIAQLWGRARIKDLMNQIHWGETPSLVEQVTDTALDYRLLSDYTAFVAVSKEVRVDPQNGSLQIEVPVEQPEGVVSNLSVPQPTQFAGYQPPAVPASAPPPSTNQKSNKNNASVPEPGQIIGNLLAILLLGTIFGWKRLQKLIKGMKVRSDK